jgi:hypothetical protein
LNKGRPGTVFLRLMSTAVINQAVLSAASLLVGLLLLRHTSDLHYGYYVLGTTALMLASGLQSSFIAAPMVNRLTHGDPQQRADLVGGLFREQRFFMRVCGAVIIGCAGELWLAGVLDRQSGPLAIATTLAAVAVLNREFFRAVLLAYRRPQDVLPADLGYVAALVATASLAIMTPLPGVAAILGLGLAAVLGGWLLQRKLNRLEPYNIHGSPGILRSFVPVGTWSMLGSGIHWAFNQGYTYLIAGTLGVPAVAAVSATRLLMMPVNLVSTGMGSVMMPLAARWLHDRGPASVMRRLTAITLGLATLALVYFGVMWVLRDFIFGTLLHKHFADRDHLLKLWVGVFLLILCRDQMIWLLAVRERFRDLAVLTAFSAALALVASYFAMLRMGVSGALVGIMAGEILQVAGILVLSFREARTVRARTAGSQATLPAPPEPAVAHARPEAPGGGVAGVAGSSAALARTGGRLSLRPAASFAWRQLGRVVGSRGATLAAVAQRSWDVAPGNMLTTLPALYLPGQLARVTGSVYGYHWSDDAKPEPLEYQMAGGIERWQAPTRAFVLKDAWLVDGAVHKDGASHRVLPRSALLPLARVEHEVERAAVYATYDGSLFFGLWLQDDCALYPQAIRDGVPLTIAQLPYSHMGAYEQRLGMQPVRAAAAFLREAVVYDDRLQNEDKRRRCEGLRRTLLSGLDARAHPGVYIVRGSSGKARRLVNEAELAEHLRTKRGFRVAHVTDDVDTILKACAGARVLAGVEGSHLAHGFMVLEQGAGVLVIQPPDRFSAVLKRTADRDRQRYGFVVALPEGDGFRVDIGEFERTLDLFPQD